MFIAELSVCHAFRAGKKGMSLALIGPKEKWQITQLEDKLKVRFSEFRR